MRKLLFISSFILTQLLSLAQQDVLVIKNVSVIDVKNNKTLNGRTVVIEKNRITAIGTKLSIPKDASILDGTGKCLIPGLWDMHVHSLRKERIPIYFPQFVANGIIGIRDMSTPLADFDLYKASIEKNGIVIRPHFIIACGPSIDGQNNARPGVSMPVKNAEEARSMVDTLANHGVDFIKVYSMLSKDAFFAVINEAKKKKLNVVGHVPAFVSALEASDAGMKSMEHSYGILENCSGNESTIRKDVETAASNPNGPTAWASVVRTTDKAYADYSSNNEFDKKKADILFSHFAKNGTWQCPTLVVRRSFAMMNDSNFANDKRTRYIPKVDRDRWNPQTDLRNKDLNAVEVEHRKIRLREESKNVQRMKDAKVGLLAGTDLGNPFIFPGFSLHDELELLVEAGLSPLEALQTATINPARFFGMQDSVGSIERGKIADLILLNANPLQSISNTKKIAAVIVNGKLYQRKDLDRLLEMSETLVREK